MVANSEAVKHNVSVAERFPLDRIEVIGNGHRTQRFMVPPDPDLRRRLELDSPTRLSVWSRTSTNESVNPIC